MGWEDLQREKFSVRTRNTSGAGMLLFDLTSSLIEFLIISDDAFTLGLSLIS